MSFDRPRRHQDRSFLDKAHTSRCVVCSRQGADPAHLRSKGAGGGDEWFNIIFLCRICHTTQHAKGHVWMSEKYKKYKAALEARGWYLCPVRNKWARD